MHYLVCYDIEDDRLRLRIAKYLLRKGFERVQKSVFFIYRMTQKERKDFSQYLEWLKQMLNPSDSLILIPIESKSYSKIRLYGSKLPREKFSKKNLVFFVGD
jgi:CRISPR-associated endonuclease Cas2